MGDTSALTSAAKSIATALSKEGDYLYGVEDQFRALQRDLVCMQQFLQDVDANPNLLKQDGQLRNLTLDMRELAFRAEDAVDTYLVEVGSKIFDNNFLLKIGSLAIHAYPVHMLRKDIEAIQQETKAAMRRSQDFRMSIPTSSQPQGDCSGSNNSKPLAENYIHLDDEFVVGIGDDITYLVNRLTDPHDDFQVLGIVGTGGAGKSTLASQIYRHTKVQSFFSHRTFVSVSQQWSRLDLLRRISKEILGQFEMTSSENDLVRELHKFMKNKRCLVVLDDIWKKEAWDDIYPIFPRTQDLKVILTTRIEEVPRHADTKCVLHEPHLLTNDQMWELFSKGAVEGRHGIENNVEFENLGKMMLEKCYGLPLAVVTLIGILRTKTHLYEWERVNVALGGKILEGKGGSKYGVVEDMLELSYLELPAHLKPLFLYLALIPEDTEWSSKELVEMWIAEGFVTNDQLSRCETLEDKGMQFMSELAQRYIIRVKKKNYRDEVELLYLHDLMRDFCIKKANKCQFMENISSTCSYGPRTNKPRRVSLLPREEHSLESLKENKYLRTIVSHASPKHTWWERWKIKKMESIHKHFKLLRVLKISNCANTTLPNQFGNLIHLTYLSITNSDILELPKSVRFLRNLIYLKVCSDPLSPGELFKLPGDLVKNMENLRVLILPSFNSKTLGLNAERHKKLHTFSCAAGAWMQIDLPIMQQLLTLRNLSFFSFIGVIRIEDLNAIHQCLEFLKGSLQTFSCQLGSLQKFNTEKLMGIQSLHELVLDGPLVNNYSIRFPASLVKLRLCRSRIGEGIDLMEILGQLSKLRDLCLELDAYLGTQLRCRGDSFPRLEELRLEYLCNLEEWIVERGSLVRLNKIWIRRCSNLKRLPQRIKSITTLNELEIIGMNEELFRSLGYTTDGNYNLVQIGGGVDSYLIQDIPLVTLRWSEY